MLSYLLIVPGAALIVWARWHDRLQYLRDGLHWYAIGVVLLVVGGILDDHGW
jgi:hypothetical protein